MRGGRRWDESWSLLLLFAPGTPYAALGTEPKSDLRYSIVSHSVHGEFAYREDAWKIVFKMPAATLADSRGKPTVVQLYNLADDLAEKNDVAKQHPDVVHQLTIELQRRVDAGRSGKPPGCSRDDRRLGIAELPAASLER